MSGSMRGCPSQQRLSPGAPSATMSWRSRARPQRTGRVRWFAAEATQAATLGPVRSPFQELDPSSSTRKLAFGARGRNDSPVGHPQRPYIEALVASGITAGCGNGNYRPDAPLTRGQMAVFLSKGLG